VKSLVMDRSAAGALELANCWEMARRKVLVVSAELWERVWMELAQNAVTAAENKPVFNQFSIRRMPRVTRSTYKSEKGIEFSIPSIAHFSVVSVEPFFQ